MRAQAGLDRGDLFDRKAPGVALTRQGEAVVAHARRLLALNDQILTVTEPKDQSRRIRIGLPGDLSGQSPAPLGVAGLDMSPLTPEAKEQLNQDLNASITDASLLAVVKSRLDDILRNAPPGWEDEARWTGLASTAKEPSAAELAQIHAKLACEDPGGSIASRMAARAIESATEPFGKAYAKDFATALLADSCEGGKALTRETRTALKDLVSAQE